MKNYDVIVVGAGISGMSFAHYASKAKLSVLVLEQADRIGGSFHSAAMQDQSGFWFELGAHTCYNSYRNLIEIMEDCGIANEITPRTKVPFSLLVENKVKSFFSKINFAELIISVPKAFSKKKEGETVKSYYGSILGKKNFKNVFSALFSAVPSQNADEFPADALFKKRERRKDILKNYTMKNGLESVITSIADHDNIEVKLGQIIKTIEKNQEGYLIKTENEEFGTAKLAVCTSVTSTPKLLEKISPELSTKISKIKFQKIESLGVVIPKDASKLKNFAGLVPLDEDFFSAVSRDTIPDENYRGFTFHFKPDKMTQKEKTEKICNVLGITEDLILETRERVNIVPSLRLSHYELIDEIDALLKNDNLFLSGNYFAGLSIEDCVSRSKTEVRRMLKK
jgi:protoporphyrinogen/coproporphyrinogen III oxidase